MPIGNELDARGIAAEVAAELEAEQVAAEVKPEVEAPKEEPKKEPEVKPEVQAPPKEEVPEKKAERPDRETRSVPIKKANAWRHEAQEAKAKAAELEQKLAEMQAAGEQAKANDIELIAKEVAGEDASPEVVKRILEASKKFSRPEVPEEYKSVLALKQQLESQAEEQGFSRELSQVLTKFPELTGHEADLKEAAYTLGNEKIPLDLLAYRLRDELNLSAKPPSAEGRAAQAASEPELDFGNLTDAQLEKLSDQDLDKFIAWQREGVHKRTGVKL